MPNSTRFALLLFLSMSTILTLGGCSGGDDGEGAHRPAAAAERPAAGKGGGGAGGAGRFPGGPRGAGGPAAAVPVEVATAERRAISSFIETNGTLEAETEVDVVARVGGPVVHLGAEESQFVRQGSLLARIEDLEYRAQREVARVALEEARLAFERAETLRQDELVSDEDYERARSAHATAKAQFEAATLQFGFTEVRAPFDGWVVARYVDFAQQVTSNTPLYRLSDFNPLLCPIQVPERELARLHRDQRAYVTVEPFPGERFPAKVLRISPVVDAASGTIKVTLEVRSKNKLRPGMFARVFVETDTRPDAVVIPKAALSLESLGDTVYVLDGATASRREVELGFAEGDFVEIVSGVAAGDSVVVVGQDGLSDGTPIQVLAPTGSLVAGEPASGPAAAGDRGEAPGGGRGPGARPDLSSMTPEQLEQVKERMRQRGMTDAQIEERLRRLRERPSSGGGDAGP